MKSAWSKILVIVCVIAIVSAGAYYWQTQKQNQSESSSVTTTQKQNQNESSSVTPSQTAVVNTAEDVSASANDTYVSKELGYKLVVPAEWKKYNYKVTYKYISKGDPESEGDERYEDVYSAQFPDWSDDYELLVIGSMPTAIWNAALANYEAAVNADENTLLRTPVFLMNKITETGKGARGKVYYYYYFRQDAPAQYAQDGLPMPDMSKDFSVESK